MAEARRGDENQGIKLFGATITLHIGGEVKQGEKGSSDVDQTVEERPEKIIACPRCKSMETKFCYFNNYNINQPRHFCKSCQRYWTDGGALRDVPIGAGRRKAKPRCHVGGGGLPDGCLYETASDDDGLEAEQGLVLDKWRVATPQGGFRQAFPAKRRRTTPASGGYRSAPRSIKHLLSSTKAQKLKLHTRT